MLIVTPAGEVERANRAANELFGRRLTGRSLTELPLGGQADFFAFLRRCSGVANILVGSLAITAPQGEEVRYRCRGRLLSPAGARPARILLMLQPGREAHFAGLTQKIDELNREIHRRRHIQAVLEEALRDRELLFRELNHRVRNNIQMLSGILALAMQEVRQPEALAVLEDARNRIEAVGTAHQLFYRADKLEGLRSDDLVRTVCENFFALGARKGVRVTVEADSVKLSNDSAIPVALILNELLSNAVKHGVKDRPDASVRVRLRAEGEEFELSVEDDGPGFDPVAVAKRSSGIGLIRGLARQLGGSFSVERTGFTRCVLRFRNWN